MSQEGSSPRSETIIAIVSDSKSFHTSLLAQFISAEHNAECLVFGTAEPIPPGTKLVLLDCFQSSPEALTSVLRELSVVRGSVNAALLNAEQREEHEALLDWSCISGIFYIDTEQEQLSRGIAQLLNGDYWVPRRLLHHFFTKHRQNISRGSVIPVSSIQLTTREKEILIMIKDGMSNSDVSESLKLSEHTVKSHLYNIYKKIGVRNRMEASNWARDQQDIDAL